MSYATIEAAINTKLSSINQLQNVQRVHKTNLPGFPAATFEPSGNENRMEDTISNLRHYSFDVVVHQEITVAGREEAKNILMDVLDAIIAAFDSDFTLGGVVHSVMPLPAAWGTYQAGNASILYATLEVKCMLLVNVG